MSECFIKRRYQKKGSEGIYGAEWAGTSSPVWTRTDDAALFSDPSPAVSNGNGSSPFDNIMPWAGMVREERTGGTMVKIPKYWYKWTRSGNYMKLQIANYAAEGFLVSPAHADRGDNVGERDYVYVGAYHCASDYKSKTGVKPVDSITRPAFRTAIHALGTDIWQFDFAMYWTIMMLYLVEFANWNSQAMIGYGCGGANISSNGLCDNMTYHTGTNTVNRTTYGHVRYRYIEGLWSNLYTFCDGIYFLSNGTNTRIYCIKNPANFSDDSGGADVGSKPNLSAGISKWTNPSAAGFEYALFPVKADGDEGTYICDNVASSSSSSGTVLRVGAYYNSKALIYGAFYMHANSQPAYSGISIGGRIMELPS